MGKLSDAVRLEVAALDANAAGIPGHPDFRYSTSAAFSQGLALAAEADAAVQAVLEDVKLPAGSRPTLAREKAGEYIKRAEDWRDQNVARLDTQLLKADRALDPPPSQKPGPWVAGIWQDAAQLDALELASAYLHADPDTARALESMPPRLTREGITPRLSAEVREQRRVADADPAVVAKRDGLRQIKEALNGLAGTMRTHLGDGGW